MRTSRPLRFRLTAPPYFPGSAKTDTRRGYSRRVSGDLLRRYIPGPGVDQRVVMVDCGASANCRAREAGTQTDYYHADRQGKTQETVTLTHFSRLSEICHKR